MNSILKIDNEILLDEICRLLAHGKRVKLRAKGNSMAPFIHGEEDILVLGHSGILRRGDVVLARVAKKGYVVHRIIAIRADRITLMGDGNLYETEDCRRQDVYGTVESVIRAGQKRDVRSSVARVRAMIWHCLLPFRRMKAILRNRSLTTSATYK